jgi:hypothetical protein
MLEFTVCARNTEKKKKEKRKVCYTTSSLKVKERKKVKRRENISYSKRHPSIIHLPLICRLIIVIIVNLLTCRHTTLDFVFEDLTLRSEVLVGNIRVRLLQAKGDAVLLLLLRYVCV